MNNYPFLEVYKKNDVEVLYLVNGVDVDIVTVLREYKGFSFQNAMFGALDLNLFDGTEQITKHKLSHQKRFRYLCEAIKEILYDHIQDVTISYRMIESPLCLIPENTE